MSTCLTCGAELPSQARFCGTCGTPFQPGDEIARPDAPRWQAIIPTDVSAAETVIQQPQTPLPSTNPQSGYAYQGFQNAPPQYREDEERNRQAGFIGMVPLVGAEMPPAPYVPTIQGAPHINPIPTVHGAPSMPGNAASPYYPQTDGHQLASGHPAPPTHFPEQAGHLGHTGHVAHAGQATAAKAAGGIATKWLAIVLATVIVAAAGGGGVLAYVLTRPQPVISISSTYTVGRTPAGSNGTTLHLKGQKFSSHSAITFLLDSRAAPDAPRVVSDQNGNVSADLPITAAWPLGRHTLTARDADNYTSKIGILIEVVAQGQAHTPGPNGAPPDDASFTLTTSLQGQYDGGNGPFSGTEKLIVTGHPSGGNVCKDRDNGQPQHLSGLTTNNGLPYTEDLTFSCAGTYKSGQISYTETLLAAVATLTDQGNSYVCHLLTPGVDEQLSGSYTTSGGFGGNMSYSSFPQSDFSCTTGQLAYFYFYIYGGSGTWTGTYTLN